MEDLKYAESKLPDKASPIGHPTLWSAKTMLADVYLQMGLYAAARDKANEVIQSQKYSLVPVTTVADFQEDVFGPTLISTTEEIFYLKYARKANQQNYMLWIINHEATGKYNFGGA